MSKLAPISHNDLIRRLKMFGFDGPYSGGKHLYMLKGKLRLTIPNPHRREISVGLLKPYSRSERSPSCLRIKDLLHIYEKIASNKSFNLKGGEPMKLTTQKPVKTKKPKSGITIHKYKDGSVTVGVRGGKGKGKKGGRYVGKI